MALAVSVAPVQSLTWDSVLNLTAEVTAEQNGAVPAELGGVVQLLAVSEGQSVRKGQLLAVIHAVDARQAVAEAEATLLQAQVLEREREAHWSRTQHLFEQGFVSAAAVSAAKAEWESASFQRQAAQARWSRAAQTQEKAQVLAPSDGVIHRVRVSQGSVVRAFDTVVDMWFPENAQLKVHIPRQYLGQIVAGTRVSSRESALEWSGVVEQLSPVLNSSSQTFEATLRAPAALRDQAGAWVSVAVHLPAQEVLAIPVSAVQLRDRQSVVFVREGERAREVPVTTGSQRKGLVEVRSGLQAADEVLVEGAAFVRNGQPIRVARQESSL